MTASIVARVVRNFVIAAVAVAPIFVAACSNPIEPVSRPSTSVVRSDSTAQKGGSQPWFDSGSQSTATGGSQPWFDKGVQSDAQTASKGGSQPWF